MSTSETNVNKCLKKIELTYRRVPKQHVFSGMVRLIEFEVDVESEKVTTSEVSCEPFHDKFFDELIYRIHTALRANPSASVTTICQASDGNSSRDRVHDLNDAFRDVLRDDLTRALELFRPTEVIVKSY